MPHDIQICASLRQLSVQHDHRIVHVFGFIGSSYVHRGVVAADRQFVVLWQLLNCQCDIYTHTIYSCKSVSWTIDDERKTPK